MSDRDAAKFLGVTYATIRNGVKRGALTRIQKAGIVQQVPKEQVELFKGKRILLGELSPSELKKWQAINDALSAAPLTANITTNPTPVQVPAPVATEPMSIEEMRRAEETVRFLARIGEMFKGEVQSSPLPVASKSGRVERLQSYFDDEGEFETAFQAVMARAFASFENGEVDADKLTKFFEDVSKNGTDQEKMIAGFVIGAPVVVFLIKALIDWLRNKNILSGILPKLTESTQGDEERPDEERPGRKRLYA